MESLCNSLPRLPWIYCALRHTGWSAPYLRSYAALQHLHGDRIRGPVTMWDEELKILQTQEHQRTPLKVRDTKEKKKKSGWGNASLRNPPSTGRLPGLVRASRIFLNPSFITPWWDASLRKLVPVLPVSPDIFRAHVALSPTNTNIDGVNPLLDPHKPSSSLTMSTVYPAQKSHPPDDF